MVPGKFDQWGTCQVASVPNGKGSGWPFPLWDLTLAVKTEAAFKCTLSYILCAHVQWYTCPAYLEAQNSLQEVVLSTVNSGLASGAAFPH